MAISLVDESNAVVAVATSETDGQYQFDAAYPPGNYRLIAEQPPGFLDGRETAGTLGGWNWRGYPWREGSVWRNGFNTLLPPNKPCYRPNGQWWELVTPASSYHPGGVNACFADGSVRFVSEAIDPDVWAAAGTRAGGEALTLP